MLDVLTNILQTTVLYATPLILAAIGGLFSERSGVVNIGLEGLMTIGAFTGAVVTLATHNPWIGLLAAIVAGILFALPHAVASITFKQTKWSAGWPSTFSLSGCRSIW